MNTIKPMYPAYTNARSTVTLGEISDETNSVTVADASVFPDVPCLATLAFDQETAETVLITAKNGNVLGLERGVSGTPLTWYAGTRICRVFSAKDLNDIQYNIRVLDERHKSVVITLNPGAWAGNPLQQQVAVPEIIADDNDVEISLGPEDIDAYWEAGILAVTMVAGSITFRATRKPDVAIDVCLDIWR